MKRHPSKLIFILKKKFNSERKNVFIITSIDTISKKIVKFLNPILSEQLYVLIAFGATKCVNGEGNNVIFIQH